MRLLATALLVLLFAVFSDHLFAQVPTITLDTPTDAATVEGGWQTLATPTFKVGYPGVWTVDTSAAMGPTFILLSPQASLDDAFRDNINLLIQDLTGSGVDLDQFVELSTSQVETMIPDGAILVSERLDDGQRPAHHMAFTGTQDPYRLRFDQYYWVFEERAYILTFTAEIDTYEDYAETWAGIRARFSLKLK